VLLERPTTTPGMLRAPDPASGQRPTPRFGFGARLRRGWFSVHEAERGTGTIASTLNSSRAALLEAVVDANELP
jgi:hypothetical protein